MNIIEEIKRARHAISLMDITHGTHQQLIQHGLTWLLLCEFGSERSCTAAKMATGSEIPAMYIVGGLTGILKYKGSPNSLSQITQQINTTPNVGFYTEVLPHLNYTLFSSVDHFEERVRG